MTSPNATPISPAPNDVLDAAKAIVEAFAATDTEAYFAGFAPDASFVFHPEPRRLDSRAEYEATWKQWLASGWHVVACRSSEQLVQTFPGGAVFSHTVDTTVYTGTEEESYTERESIIFRREADGSLMAVHEHLSTVPGPEDDGTAADRADPGATSAEDSRS